MGGYSRKWPGDGWLEAREMETMKVNCWDGSPRKSLTRGQKARKRTNENKHLFNLLLKCLEREAWALFLRHKPKHSSEISAHLLNNKTSLFLKGFLFLLSLSITAPHINTHLFIWDTSSLNISWHFPQSQGWATTHQGGGVHSNFYWLTFMSNMRYYINCTIRSGILITQDQEKETKTNTKIMKNGCYWKYA